MSVGFSVHSAVQCQSIASAQFCSVQCKQRSESIASVQFLKRSVFRVESVAYSQWSSVLAGLQSTAFMVCLLLFSVGSEFSLVFSCQRGSVVQCLWRSRCVLFSGSFSVYILQGLQCSEHWLFTKCLSCSESTL